MTTNNSSQRTTSIFARISFATAGLAISLSTLNWGYHYEHEFNATVDGYEGQTTCATADDCTTLLTHMRVTNEDIDKQIWLTLDRPITLENNNSALSFNEGARGTVTASITPNTRARMHTSHRLELDGATFTPQM